MRALFALVCLSLSPLTFASDEYIQVQGRCEMRVTPDRVMVTFTAENQSKDQKDAFKRTNDQIEKIKAEIKKLGLEKLELKSTAYNVYPVREYEKDKIIDKGMKISLSLQVTTSQIERIGETLLIASRAGIVNVGTLQTFLSQEKSRQEYLKCLDIAADDARGKAKQLAKRLDVNLGKVVKIVESPAPAPAPIYHQREAMSMAKSDMGGAPQIEAGQQDFTTTIDVSFGIK